MKLDILQSDFARCAINPTIHSIPFSQWKTLPKTPGLYSIWQGDVSVYVGQAGGKSGIGSRFLHHWNKAFGIFETQSGKRNSTQDGSGWRSGRSEAWWDPSCWMVEYFECAKATHRTYLEGTMMLLLDPACNDECWRDKQDG
jgi:hypothetical protein